MKTIIFGGTTEGREQAALALARGESVLVSVTSEYARQFLPEGAACHIGALDAPTRCISPTCASSARRTGARIGATR